MRYIKNIAIAIDQFFNTLLFGWPDETLSSRSYRCCPVMAFIIDRLFWFDPDHCRASFESERRRMQSPPEERHFK
ncbi:MAG: hypothetical protein ACXWAT_00115 [Methylobacter sp.]